GTRAGEREARGFDCRAGCQFGDLDRFGTGVGIGVEFRRTATHGVDAVEIPGGVHARQFFARRGPRLAHLSPCRTEPLGHLVHRTRALGPLRMPWRGGVLFEAGGRDENEGHGPLSTGRFEGWKIGGDGRVSARNWTRTGRWLPLRSPRRASRDR